MYFANLWKRFGNESSTGTVRRLFYQRKPRTILSIFNIIRYPSKLWYYIKFHCARTASTDAIKYRRRPAPVRYVTTQGKMLEIVRYPGVFLICKFLKSYGGIFMCDHSNITKQFAYNNYNLVICIFKT